MKAEKIGAGVYADTSGEGKGNIGAVELPNFTVVVDSTISKETALAFKHSLETQVQSPIQKLFLTHYHADHTLGIPTFKGCEIFASKPYKNLRKTIKYQPTSTFEKTLTFKDEGYVIQATHVGGHTADSSHVYLPQEKVLFSGDLLFAKTFFYAGDRTFNPEKWIEALRSFSDMKIDKIVPGHGPLCGKEEVEIYLEFFKATSKIMKDLVEIGVNERQAVKRSEFHDFYPEYRKGVREQALANWYRFYKKRAR